MSGGQPKKVRTLPDEAREAALDSAAATLAAIYMAKKVGAEVMPQRDGSCGRGPLTPDLRAPLGDVLFGVAQIQVDFVRRLFEFNKAASVKLRERLKTNLSAQADRSVIKVTQPRGASYTVFFELRNSATMARMFVLHGEIAQLRATFRSCDPSESESNFKEREGGRLSVKAGGVHEVKATFAGELRPGTHSGHIDVDCNGIRVDRFPVEITVT